MPPEQLRKDIGVARIPVAAQAPAIGNFISASAAGRTIRMPGQHQFCAAIPRRIDVPDTSGTRQSRRSPSLTTSARPGAWSDWMIFSEEADIRDPAGRSVEGSVTPEGAGYGQTYSAAACRSGPVLCGIHRLQRRRRLGSRRWSRAGSGMRVARPARLNVRRGQDIHDRELHWQSRVVEFPHRCTPSSRHRNHRRSRLSSVIVHAGTQRPGTQLPLRGMRTVACVPPAAEANSADGKSKPSSPRPPPSPAPVSARDCCGRDGTHAPYGE